MFDLIGDIHGHAAKLKILLEKLGYTDQKNGYCHPTRKVLFLGDYIDRGPEIRETLQLVRTMVESGNALALMGNHEYNALCFHFQETEGGHLRKHLIKNIIQHYETLKQFQNRQEEYEDYLEWFKTLPLFFETESFRAVHACWDPKLIRLLRQHLCHETLTDELIYKSVKKGTLLNTAFDVTLKGKEIPMPEGLFFKDKDGTIRKNIRIRWWENPNTATYRSLSVLPLKQLPEKLIDTSLWRSTDFYSETERPVFFGHYWLEGDTPVFYKNNVCCLDYSVANKGHLVAYRMDGEQILQPDKLIYV